MLLMIWDRPFSKYHYEVSIWVMMIFHSRSHDHQLKVGAAASIAAYYLVSSKRFT